MPDAADFRCCQDAFTALPGIKKNRKPAGTQKLEKDAGSWNSQAHVLNSAARVLIAISHTQCLRMQKREITYLQGTWRPHADGTNAKMRTTSCKFL